MDNTFEIGDVVVMKSFDENSPNPQMTIRSIDNDQVWCDYYSPVLGVMKRITMFQNQITKVNYKEE